MTKPNTISYRPDIDGLRAIAVILVIGFHAFPHLVRGGFVGVDIFFVISGYLISSILRNDLANGTFRFRIFYAARIRRIFPALLVILITCLAAGWFMLPPDTLALLGNHVAGGAGFISNLMLWQEAGYFDAASESKPLLHLWSLGIEEQFYILWPFLLWWAHKMRWPVMPFLLAIALASFVTNISLAKTDMIGDFYSPVSRFWELMMGAALAASNPKQWRLIIDGIGHHVLSCIGLFLIFGAAILFETNMVFPSWRALVPACGAALLIIAGPEAWLNRRLLSYQFMVSLGLISYPLYLWHWPVLTFLHAYEGHIPSSLHRLFAIGTSTILAVATYQFVEKPVRFGRFRDSAAPVLCLLMASIGGIGYGVAAQGSTPSRPAVQAIHVVNYDINTERERINRRYVLNSCAFDSSIIPEKINRYCSQYGNTAAKKTVVLWGDSHAGEYLQPLSWSALFYELAEEHGDTRVIRFSTPGCPPLIGIRRSGTAGDLSNCRDITQGAAIAEAIGKLNPDWIVLIARWSLYATGQRYANGGLQPDYLPITTDPDDSNSTQGDAMQEKFLPTLEALPHLSKILIIKHFPVLYNDVNAALAASTPEQGEASLERIEPTTQQHRALTEFSYHLIDEAAKRSNTYTFDPAPFLCDNICRSVKNGRIMYRDDSHPSQEGSLLFKPSVEKILYP